MGASNPHPARTPTIVAPVSRHLVVADAARSDAFYRDVLGFEERDVLEEYFASFTCSTSKAIRSPSARRSSDP